MILDAWRMGFVRGYVMDLTPGEGEGGLWSTRLVHEDPESDYVTPPLVVRPGIKSLEANSDRLDFRSLPWDTNEYHTVFYDPPYVSTGGRETSGLQDFLKRFGLREAPKTPEELFFRVMEPGLFEALRIVKPWTPKNPAYVLMKCKPYISGGNYKPVHHWVSEVLQQWQPDNYYAEIVAEFYMVSDPMVQPGDTQKTPRNNFSILQVIRKKAIR